MIPEHVMLEYAVAFTYRSLLALGAVKTGNYGRSSKEYEAAEVSGCTVPGRDGWKVWENSEQS